ncbi:uncharacterized protein MELLADRAFT_106709 [Melampsora larici-populina 98AG31]|uniref:Cytochrome b561 domain-containing protein n=1 Tax=Melampsora larici-populina (strain 98AG31 / pathotype 3-4-7) TaxID=747676 RepID=F4RMD8_MELLP|nr:uncharacterized protein MELLADRAFT_106709 [Melampsora larici-populina 98AG31]EGG06411.1 hypothetical protein MELLADRAFT_106709 [Melampsora larici-populina 98AG31]
MNDEVVARDPPPSAPILEASRRGKSTAPTSWVGNRMQQDAASNFTVNRFGNTLTARHQSHSDPTMSFDVVFPVAYDAPQRSSIISAENYNDRIAYVFEDMSVLPSHSSYALANHMARNSHSYLESSSKADYSLTPNIKANGQKDLTWSFSCRATESSSGKNKAWFYETCFCKQDGFSPDMVIRSHIITRLDLGPTPRCRLSKFGINETRRFDRNTYQGSQVESTSPVLYKGQRRYHIGSNVLQCLANPQSPSAGYLNAWNAARVFGPLAAKSLETNRCAHLTIWLDKIAAIASPSFGMFSPIISMPRFLQSPDGIDHARLVGQDAVTGASFQTSTFTASVLTNTTHAKIDFVLIIPQSKLGWIAIGHGTRMSNSRMMIIWPVGEPDEEKGWVISYRSTTGHILPKSLRISEEEPLLKIHQSKSVKKSTVSFNFIRPLSLGPSDTLRRKPAQEFVWAVSSLRPPGMESNGRILYHDLGYGLVNLNLDETLLPNGTIRSETYSLRDLTHSYRHDGLITVHATVLSVAWIFCAPAAVLSARFMRASSLEWVKIHWILQIFTVLLTLIGIICAACAVGSGSHFDSHQKKMGFFVVIGMLFQVLEGYIIHAFSKKSETKRALKNWLHIIFGCSLILLSWATIVSGIEEWEAQGRGTPVSVSVIMGLMMGLALFLYAMRLWRTRQDQDKSEGDKQIQSMIEISHLDVDGRFDSSLEKELLEVNVLNRVKGE